MKGLSGVRQLLRSRDLDLVQQGLELLRAGDDPSAWGTLLDGVSYSGCFEDGSSEAAFGGPYRGRNALYGITQLLGHGQPDWVQNVTRLDLRKGLLVSIEGLSHLPSLKQLHVHGAGPFLELEGEFPSLDLVLLERPVGLSNIDWLLGAPRLRRLELHHLPGLDLGLALSVEELVVKDWSLQNLEPLTSMSRLRRLELKTPAVRSLEPLLDLNLEEVHIGRLDLDSSALEDSGVRVLR